MICPKCGSEHTKKNGHIHSKKQKYQCNTCKYQFVENPENKIISYETKELVEKLLLERISIAGIARVLNISEKWLQTYINDRYDNNEKKLKSRKNQRASLLYNVMKRGLLLVTANIYIGFGLQ